MILAAGRGERLRPLTDRTPKPLLPIGGEPLIAHQLRWLRRAGIREAFVNLHHLGDRIERAIGTGRRFDMRVRYGHERELLETGGGVRKALPWLRPGPFVLLNGDIWTDYPFERLLRRQPPAGHLVLTANPRAAANPGAPVPSGPRRAADFHLAGDRLRRDPVCDDLTYCGIAMLAEALFEDAPDGPFSLRDLLFRGVAEGALTGERYDGLWIDIGTPDQLRRARRLAE